MTITSPQPDRLLIPIPDACHQLGDIGRATIYELFNERELVRVHVGRRSFVTGESLTTYVERLSKAATEQDEETATEQDGETLS